MSSRRFFWLAVGMVAILGALCGCGPGSLTTKELDTEKIAVNLVRETGRGGYEILTTPELKVWLDAKKDMLIIETMPFADSYKKNHIPQAVSFEFPIPEDKELDDFKQADFAKLLGPDKDKVLLPDMSYAAAILTMGRVAIMSVSAAVLFRGVYAPARL